MKRILLLIAFAYSALLSAVGCMKNDLYVMNESHQHIYREMELLRIAEKEAAQELYSSPEMLLNLLAKIEHFLSRENDARKCLVLQFMRRKMLKAIMSQYMLSRIPHGGAPFVGFVCCVPNEESLDNLQVTGIAAINNLIVNALTVSGNLIVGGNVVVGGNVSVGGTICTSNGSAAAPSYTFCSTPDIGLFTSGSGDVQVATSGLSRVTVSTSGAVFMGPADPSFGTLNVTGASGVPAVQVTQDVGANAIATGSGSASVPAYSFSDSLSTGAYSGTSDEFDIATAGTQRVSIDASAMSLINGISLRLYETQPAQANSVDIIAPSAVTASYTLTLPAAVGTTNQVLGLADNSGTLTWLDPILQNGNAFGTGMVIGTTDANSVTIQTNSVDRMSIDTNGLVSIATVAGAGSGLSVTGGSGVPAIDVTAQLGQNAVSVSSGTAAAPAYSFSGNSSTGMYSAGANEVNLATNGSEIFRATTDAAMCYSKWKMAASLSGSQSFTSSTPSVNGSINFDTNIFDPGNRYTSGTGSFNIPVAGTYLITTTLILTSSGTNNTRIYFTVDGGITAIRETTHTVTSADGSVSVTLSAIVHVPAGVNLRVWVDAGVGVDTVTVNATSNESIHLLSL